VIASAGAADAEPVGDGGAQLNVVAGRLSRRLFDFLDVRPHRVEHVMRHMLHPVVIARVAHDLGEDPCLAVCLEARRAVGDHGSAAELLHPALLSAGSGGDYGVRSVCARIATRSSRDSESEQLFGYIWGAA